MAKSAEIVAVMATFERAQQARDALIVAADAYSAAVSAAEKAGYRVDPQTFAVARPAGLAASPAPAKETLRVWSAMQLEGEAR